MDGAGHECKIFNKRKNMETWAHAQELYDTLGVDRINEDRIKNIVIIGNNTFKYCFTINKKELPEETPRLELTAPSGEVWEFNNPTNENKISGKAEEFCQVVTQVRNIEDVNLNVSGDIANDWMYRSMFCRWRRNSTKARYKKKVNRKN